MLVRVLRFDPPSPCRPAATDLAVIEPTPDGLLLRERAPGIGVEQILGATAARLIVPEVLPEMCW